MSIEQIERNAFNLTYNRILEDYRKRPNETNSRMLFLIERIADLKRKCPEARNEVIIKGLTMVYWEYSKDFLHIDRYIKYVVEQEKAKHAYLNLPRHSRM